MHYAPEIISDIRKWKESQKDSQGDYLFPFQAAAYLGLNRKPDKSLPCKQFQRFLRDACEINTEDSEGRTVKGFHSLRVSHATYSRFAGATVEQIQAHLAHSKKEITEGYIQKTDEEIKREIIIGHKPLSLPGASGPEHKKEKTEPPTAEEKLARAIEYLEKHDRVSGNARKHLLGLLKGI